MKDKYMPLTMRKSGFKYCIVCSHIFVDNTKMNSQITCTKEECKKTYCRIYAHLRKEPKEKQEE